MKIVLNKCYGGFGLSDTALELYNLKANRSLNFDWDIERNDLFLIEAVEELGHLANGGYADLKVVEIPDGSHFVIDEYDGKETLYYSKTEIKSI